MGARVTRIAWMTVLLALQACGSCGGGPLATPVEGGLSISVVLGDAQGATVTTVTVWPTNGLETDACPTINATASLDGQPLKEMNAGGWLKPASVFQWCGTAPCPNQGCPGAFWTVAPEQLQLSEGVSRLTIDDTREVWSMDVAQLAAQRTITPPEPVDRGTVATFLWSPVTDIIGEPLWVQITTADGGATGLGDNDPSKWDGGIVSYDGGRLMVQIPLGLPPGDYVLTLQTAPVPDIIDCNGPTACSVEFSSLAVCRPDGGCEVPVTDQLDPSDGTAVPFVVR